MAVGFSSAVDGLGGRRARHELALLCQEQGRAEEAGRHWGAILADAPDFLPAWRGLGELYLTHQRWNELDAVIAELGAGAGEGLPLTPGPSPPKRGRGEQTGPPHRARV